MDEILKRHLIEAKAGVPDKSIARASGLSTAQVQRWRLRHGIRRLHPTNRQRGHAAAIAIFGRCSLPTAMEVESRVNGTWEPPEYMVRFPIEYSDFVSLVGTLIDAGYKPTRIAKGLGVRPQDVVTAVQLHAREAA